MSTPIHDFPVDFKTLLFKNTPLSSICDLPDDILKLILKGVPFLSIVECRGVCKQWKDFISSSEFSSQFENCPNVLPMLVRNHQVEGWSIRFLNSRCGSWVSLSLSFLQDDHRSGQLYLTASSGGLMCFETTNRRSFIICNPITKQWRHLQLPVADDKISSRPCSCLNPTFCIHQAGKHFHKPDMLTGLIVDRQGGSYKLIVAFLAESLERGTFIYDSLKGSWTRGAQVPGGKGFVNPVTLSVEGNLYCLIDIDPYDAILGGYSSSRKVVSKYDAKHDRWLSSAPLPCPLNRGNEFELLEHKGGVKLLTRAVERKSVYKLFYNFSLNGNPQRSISVFSVLEVGDELQVIGSHWNGRQDWSDLQIESILEYVGYSGDLALWETKASAYSASCAGHDEDIYIMVKLENNVEGEGEVDTFHVMKVNFTPNAFYIVLLPSFGKEDCEDETQVELRTFQPSLTAGV